MLRERAAPRFNVPTFGDGLMGRPCTQLDVSRAVGRTTAGPLTPDDAGRQVPAPMPDLVQTPKPVRAPALGAEGDSLDDLGPPFGGYRCAAHSQQ